MKPVVRHLRIMALLCVLPHSMLAQTASQTMPALPDWSGGWHLRVTGLPPLPPLLQLLHGAPPPLRPDRVAEFQAMAAAQPQGNANYCWPAQVVGFQNGTGFEDTIEFLFTPGRVTLLDEQGLVRRIFTDGRPAEPDESNTGMSVGHWEGGTLVVETTGLNPRAWFPLPMHGAPRIGRNARLIERISLQGNDTLVIHSVMTAPELFTRPFEITSTYQRERGYTPRESATCVDDDRLTQSGTGQLQFDLTPPLDLPPPPAVKD